MAPAAPAVEAIKGKSKKIIEEMPSRSFAKARKRNDALVDVDNGKLFSTFVRICAAEAQRQRCVCARVHILRGMNRHCDSGQL